MIGVKFNNLFGTGSKVDSLYIEAIALGIYSVCFQCFEYIVCTLLSTLRGIVVSIYGSKSNLRSDTLDRSALERESISRNNTIFGLRNRLSSLCA